MPNFRRAFVPGGTFFFTVVTFNRQRFLTQLESRNILHEVINEVKRKYPFKIDSWVLLPEHLHCIWSLPEGDSDFSKRWGLIKAWFSKRTKGFLYKDEWMTNSKRKYRESTIWQRRFWEHMVRDEDDFNKHMNYVHFNPVKHGLVKSVNDWPYSTFHRCVRDGLYPPDWGGDDSSNTNDTNFGE
ncbi:transposase and inactivated derivatives [Candidatus Scalindua japonica]|uniref:Transposase and inactivated derivatives n=1 Tax=Candidatus Scalindua japonica TaxID=1284222 RepID=A0A286U182_9BACT|nr:transposase [Candidatus Scalindua japonica]GAX61831.1 transposase and inactivated derivatives [Candidatus Scalindua japonica]